MSMRRALSFAKRAGSRSAFWAQTPLRQLPLPFTHDKFGKFVVLASGRTGSSLLVERLNSHPNLVCFGELLTLHNRIDWYTARRPQSPKMLELRERDPSSFLEHYCWHRNPLNVQQVGFKCLYEHLLSRHRAVRALLQEHPDIKVVHLKRENWLEIFVSQQALNLTGEYRRTAGQQVKSVFPLKLDASEIESFFQIFEKQSFLVEQDVSHLENISVTYENLVSRPQEVFDELSAFLGVPSCEPKSKSLKMNSSALPERVLNFCELHSHFSGSRWEKFFV